MRENIGSVGAMRERDYFGAPQSPFNAFPCRFEPVLFHKTRLAQSCPLRQSLIRQPNEMNRTGITGLLMALLKIAPAR